LALNQQASIERQLFLDISELCQRDAATGVQRVVRSYLKYLLQSPPFGFRVEPVYATLDNGYRYARNYTQRFLGLNNADVSDESIRWQRGDIFFGLDMQHHVQLEHRWFYQQLQKEGVTVKFFVHDLLPIQLPDLFRDSNAKQLHEQWLSMITSTNGAICNSKTTADSLTQWIKNIDLSIAPTFQTTWVHIGADIEGSSSSKDLAFDSDGIFAEIRARRTFLCVSTLEPRKGQQQILDAFEQLWAYGTDVNLVFVGNQGWKVEALAKRIRNHPEQGTRLFWLQGISDEYLEKVYLASTCLIVASINEGFGLPLIEAAHYGIPIIARDISVFREVAGNSAFYFSGETPEHLSEALQVWLGMHAQEKHPQSHSIKRSSWQESTEKLKVALVSKSYPRK
jgi:glycosyltransferase involved in cell wall biosynthesis